MSYHVRQRIDELLRTWEAACRICRVGDEFAQNQGAKKGYSRPLETFEQLRRFLIKVGHEAATNPNFTIRDDRLPFMVFDDDMKEILQYFVLTPVCLTCWGISRKMYCVGEDLQCLFEAMDQKDHTWSDISFPFEGFALLLDVPIAGQYDCILISQARNCKVEQSLIMVRLISKELTERCSFLEKQAKDLEVNFQAAKKSGKNRKMIELGREAKEKIIKLPARLKGLAPVIVFEQERFLESAISKTVQEILYDEDFANSDLPFEAFDLALKYLSSLCMYLEVLPEGSPLKTPWERNRTLHLLESATAQRPKNFGYITDPAEVCKITSIANLSPETRHAFAQARQAGRPGNIAGLIRPHFRSAHKRRKPGEGHNPDAPRTVKVRKYFVGGNLLPEDAVPEGHMIRIKKKA